VFGLTFEKLFLVAVIAAVLIGPRRLPLYASRLAALVRALRAQLERTREQAAAQTGLPLQAMTWTELDLARYDPRRIIREALDAPAPAAPAVPDEAPVPAHPVHPWTESDIARIRPGQRYAVVGDSAHPRRIHLASLPADDPLRLAAAPEAVAPAPPVVE
jgi:sec-independent protein translocase protein TatB